MLTEDKRETVRNAMVNLDETTIALLKQLLTEQAACEGRMDKLFRRLAL